MPTLKVRLFGHFSIASDEQAIGGFEASKVQELFSYLLLHQDHPTSREGIASLLWSEAPAAQAKKRLSQTLWQLQSALHSQPDEIPHVRLLSAEPELIRLNSQSDLWLDVAMFEDAYSRVQEISGQQLDTESGQILQAAVQIYQGDLLEGWCQEWCSYERERLQSMYLAMLDKAMVYSEVHHQYETALVYGARILHYDRAHERTHRRLMRLHYLTGDRTGALRQYRRCVDALNEDLGSRPAKRTIALYEQIRADEVECAHRSPSKPVTDPAETSTVLLDALGHLKELRVMLTAFQSQIQQEIDTIEQAVNRYS